MKRWVLIFSWSLYDLANQFFAINVVSLYFVRWLTLEKGAPEILYSLSFGISIFAVAALAPLLGLVSDMTGRRKPFLTWLTMLCIVFTMLLGAHQSVLLGLLFFAVANFGCQLAVVFYNALLVNVAPKNRIGMVSGFGRMLGYSGAVIALYLIKPVVARGGFQAAFVPTGLLFLLFSLPCLIFVKDTRPQGAIDPASFFRKHTLVSVFRRLREDFIGFRSIPHVPDFLKASFLGLCVVNVLILFMSVYVTRVFRLDETQLINLFAFSTFFAIFGSFICGYISDYAGIRPGFIALFILWGISLYLGSVLRQGAFLSWIVGPLVGFSLGATWVVLRAFALKLVPGEKIGALFGLFNLIGSLSAAAGALCWGALLLLLSPLGDIGYRIALASLNIFLVFAVVFALRIREGKRQ